MNASAHCLPDAAHRVQELGEREFSIFARLANDELGIQLPHSKLHMIQSRILRRMRELGLQDYGAYLQKILSPDEAGERQEFFDRITTNRTEFYREPDHFEFLLRELPRLMHGRLLRVWSAGCASGEEAYTLAMLLADHLPLNTGRDFHILASDVSSRMIEQTKEAIYPVNRIVPVPLEQRRRYLLRGTGPRLGSVRIVPELRAKISCLRLNFMDPVYPVDPPCDVIFFRNVLIYFDRPTQAAVVSRLVKCLAPGGLLFTGHTETTASFHAPLAQVAPGVFQLNS